MGTSDPSGARTPHDAEIAKLAARQHGNVSRAQLTELGLGPRAIAHRIAAGRLHRVHRGVYAVGRPPVVALELAAADVLAAGPHGLLSHTSTLALFDVLHRWPQPTHVTVTQGDPRPPGIIIHRCALPRADRTRERGIPTTTAARALLDAAPLLTDAQLARAIDDARLARVASADQIAAAVARAPANHPGAHRIAAVLHETPRRSEWEREFPDWCAAHGLPVPTINARLGPYEVDALFAPEKVIVELDGWEFHQSRASFERDRDQDADTAAWGFVTVRLTWERHHGAPRREATRLRAILSQRRG